MDAAYGMHIEFTAQSGRADELQEILLEAARDMQANDACLLYLVSRVPDREDLVWVTEAWSEKRAHEQSLKDPATRELITRAVPLLAGRPVATVLRPGGKGL